MITGAILNFFVSVIATIFSFVPQVTSLPFGMDTAIQTFVGDVNGLLIVMPWFKIVWQLALFAILIKGVLLLLHFIVFVINIVRGSGSQLPTRSG